MAAPTPKFLCNMTGLFCPSGCRSACTYKIGDQVQDYNDGKGALPFFQYWSERERSDAMTYAQTAVRVLNAEDPAHRYSLRWKDDGKRAGYQCITVTTWDGESYIDPYFCKGGCAQSFGYFAMEHPAAETKAYADAMRKAGRR